MRASATILATSGKIEMIESSYTNASTDDSGEPSRSFRPLRARVWAIGGGGVFLLIFAAATLLLPFAARPLNGGRVDAGLLSIAILLGLFLAAMSIWLLTLAWQIGQMRVVVYPKKLELRARNQEWFITNPVGFRRALLIWPEVRGIRRWRFVNPWAPGGVQENYILYTAEGKFVLSNLDWPDVSEMAALISQNARRPIVHKIRELPDELQEAAMPSRTERANLRAVRGLGWLGSALLLALLALALLTGRLFRPALGSVALIAILFFVYRQSMRRFRLE